MMQIQTKIEQSIHDYIRDASDDPTKEEIIRPLQGKNSPRDNHTNPRTTTPQKDSQS